MRLHPRFHDTLPPVGATQWLGQSDTVPLMADGPQVPQELQRLASAVSERRRTLGLTRLQVHENGGPADTTLARIEAPTPDTAPPRPTTLQKIDKGLRWPEGTAASTLHAGTSAARREEVSRPSLENSLSFATVAMPVDLIHDVVRAADRLLSEQPESEFSSGLRHAVQRLTAVYVTEVLERVGGPGSEIPPAIGVTFRPHLTAPLAEDHGTRIEQLYRRWLAGLVLPSDAHHLVPSFEARLVAKRKDIMLRTTN